MLYTKNQDFGHSTFKETNISLFYIRGSNLNGGHFDFSRNLSNICFYMLEIFYLC